MFFISVMITFVLVRIFRWNFGDVFLNVEDIKYIKIITNIFKGSKSLKIPTKCQN